LGKFGLKVYPKTSGRTGLHLYLPLALGYSFNTVRNWVKSLGEKLAASYPELITTAHGATHRGEHVTIDYAQNSLGHNTAAPYTLRACTAASVSTPLTWEEVEKGSFSPTQFTMQTLPKRIAKYGDPFLPVLNESQHLPI